MKFEEAVEKKVIDEKIQGDVLEIHNKISGSKKLYIESYGCQMNFSDSEIVASIICKENYSTTKDISEASSFSQNKFGYIDSQELLLLMPSTRS